jgi:hypothetical protein
VRSTYGQTGSGESGPVCKHKTGRQEDRQVLDVKARA